MWFQNFPGHSRLARCGRVGADEPPQVKVEPAWLILKNGQAKRDAAPDQHGGKEKERDMS